MWRRGSLAMSTRCLLPSFGRDQAFAIFAAGRAAASRRLDAIEIATRLGEIALSGVKRAGVAQGRDVIWIRAQRLGVRYNWQYNQFVFGLEGDFGWTNAKRGRLGYAADRWLFFVAGGLAVADFNFHKGAITTTTTVPQITGATYVGWSIGGGVEYAITQNPLGRVEFL